MWHITPGDHETIYEVTLRGRIREIPTGRADLDVRLLFNGTDKERDRLRTGEEVSLMPREATFADFQRWLARNRRRDPQMQVVKNIVTVRRN